MKKNHTTAAPSVQRNSYAPLKKKKRSGKSFYNKDYRHTVFTI